MAQLSCDSAAKKKAIARLQSLPSFQVQLTDSVSIMNSKDITFPGSLVLVYFRDDCPSCKKETKIIVSNMQAFGNTKFLFLSSSTIEEIKSFSAKFKLDSHNNITVGRDYQNLFRDTFRPRAIPYIAVYDQNRKLVKIFSSPPSIENMRNATLASSKEPLTLN